MNSKKVERTITRATIKSAIAACGALAAVLPPLTASAQCDFFAKNAFGSIWGTVSDGSRYSLEFYVDAFEHAEKKQPGNNSSTGVNFFGGLYDAQTETFYWGFGQTFGIAFEANKGSAGGIPKAVSASGTISVQWCDSSDPPKCIPGLDTVSFTMNLSATKNNNVTRYLSTEHRDDGNTKINEHFDYSSVPASINDSSITSEVITNRFGPVVPTFGAVSDSKGHCIEISK